MRIRLLIICSNKYVITPGFKKGSPPERRKLPIKVLDNSSSVLSIISFVISIGCAFPRAQNHNSNCSVALPQPQACPCIAQILASDYSFPTPILFFSERREATPAFRFLSYHHNSKTISAFRIGVKMVVRSPNLYLAHHPSLAAHTFSCHHRHKPQPVKL